MKGTRPDWMNILKGKATINYRFNLPITDSEIKKFKDALGIEIPQDLLSLYRESNGIQKVTNGAVTGDLVWACSKVIKENIEFRANEDFRNLYMPFDNLLFFADQEDGDLFAFPIINGKVRPDIFSWNHKNDSRMQISANLQQFISDGIKGAE